MKKYLPFIGLLAIALAIAVATFVEDATNTTMAKEYIYGSPWFIGLWGAVVIASIPVVWQWKLWKKVPVFLLHISFIMILAGALTTHLSGKQYTIHLREGDVYKGLRLDSFNIKFYPSSEAPQDYVSYCTVFSENDSAKVEISMNRPFTNDNHRYYQSSYDPDMRGTILSVNHDPYGEMLTYIGYALLAISAILILVLRSGEMKMLIRQLKQHSSALMLVALFACSMQVHAAETTPHVMERAQADSLKTKQIIYNSRICTLNTLARDFTTKLTGKPTFRGLTAEQVLLSWALYADEWQHVDMIKVKDKKVKEQLGIKTELARFVDFFDEDGNYKLIGYKHPDIDEKLGLILWLNEGSLIQPLPKDAVPLSEAKVKAEILYNELPLITILFILCLTASFICIGFSIAQMTGARLGKKTQTIVSNASTSICIAAWIGLLFSISLRWYISGNIPLTNGLETMQFIALVALTGGCISALALPNANYVKGGAMLIAGFTLLVAHLSEMNPQITPLMPVLHSPWLSSHVSIIMISYALFAFMAINSATYLLAPHKRTQSPHPLTTLNRLLLFPSTLFLAIGIFLGAIWANQSWGTYWSWDPKESWALISMIVYGIGFHHKSIPLLQKEKSFHIYLLVAFLTILMTYFGVNYLLGGMHSYANG